MCHLGSPYFPRQIGADRRDWRSVTGVMWHAECAANAPGRLAGESRWALPGRAGEGSIGTCSQSPLTSNGPLAAARVPSSRAPGCHGPYVVAPRRATAPAIVSCCFAGTVSINVPPKGGGFAGSRRQPGPVGRT
jgi:hypothetical protein